MINAEAVPEPAPLARPTCFLSTPSVVVMSGRRVDNQLNVSVHAETPLLQASFLRLSNYFFVHDTWTGTKSSSFAYWAS